MPASQSSLLACHAWASADRQGADMPAGLGCDAGDLLHREVQPGLFRGIGERRIILPHQPIEFRIEQADPCRRHRRRFRGIGQQRVEDVALLRVHQVAVGHLAGGVFREDLVRERLQPERERTEMAGCRPVIASQIGFGAHRDQQVLHRKQMRHLLDRHQRQYPPRSAGGGLGRVSRVQILGHKAMFDLGGAARQNRQFLFRTGIGDPGQTDLIQGLSQARGRCRRQEKRRQVQKKTVLAKPRGGLCHSMTTAGAISATPGFSPRRLASPDRPDFTSFWRQARIFCIAN